MLQALGLTSSENNIYLSLLQETMQEAKDIANNLQIPLSKAYQSLTNLENLGLIFKTKSRPALFTANDPSQVVEMLLNNQEIKLDKMRKNAFNIEQQLYQLVDFRRIDSNALQINVGKNLREKNAQVMNSAEESFKIAVQIKPSHFQNNCFHLQRLFEKLTKLYNRGIRLQMIIGVDDKDQDQLMNFIQNNLTQGIIDQIRLIDEVHTIFYIIDDNKVLIKVVDPLTGDYNFTSITIWETVFVDLFKGKFARLWSDCLKIVNSDILH